MKQYDNWVELRPRNRSWIAVLALIITSIAVLITWNEQGWVRVLAYIALAAGALIGIPQLISWYASLIIQHAAAWHEAQAAGSATPDLLIKERMLEKYSYLVDKISRLSDIELQAVLAVPTPAELELLPAGAEFLVLAHRSGRIPMPIIEDIAAKWILATNSGRNPWLLPPVRMWSGRIREQVRDVYLELADEGLIIARNDKSEPWSGNLTATVAPGYAPVDVLAYLRVAENFKIETPVENDDSEMIPERPQT